MLSTFKQATKLLRINNSTKLLIRSQPLLSQWNRRFKSDELGMEGLKKLAKNAYYYDITDKTDKRTFWEIEQLTSILFSLPDKPGVLLDALKVFVDHNLNLTRIQSKPARL